MRDFMKTKLKVGLGKYLKIQLENDSYYCHGSKNIPLINATIVDKRKMGLKPSEEEYINLAQSNTNEKLNLTEAQKKNLESLMTNQRDNSSKVEQKFLGAKTNS